MFLKLSSLEEFLSDNQLDREYDSLETIKNRFMIVLIYCTFIYNITVRRGNTHDDDEMNSS